MPLNGTLDNIGISDVTVTNNGATIDNNGKIGKCYSFDGTDDSTVEVVFFKKKNTPYTSEDFQMLADTNIKETDLAREKYLYEALNRKKANGEE